MIGSLLKETSTACNTDDQSNSHDTTANSERSILEALSIVRLIVRRRLSFQCTDISDLVQGIALRLWKWRDKNREKSESMSDQEWKSYAARTAYNEVNRHLSKSYAGITVSVEIAENNAELARIMGFRETKWNDIRNRIPLSDVQIAEVTRELGDTKSLLAIARSV